MGNEDLVSNVLSATAPSRRHARLLMSARVVSVLLGTMQILIALPDLLAVDHHGRHSHQHVAAFAIAIGVGLVYAGLRPHRATGLIPPLVALTICLLLTCAVDIIHGRWPSELDIHLISPIAAGVLWGVAHLARPTTPKSTPSTPVLVRR